jgi:hypothetical protein
MRIFLVAGVLGLLFGALGGGCTLQSAAEVEPSGLMASKEPLNLSAMTPPPFISGRLYFDASTGRTIDIETNHTFAWRYRPEGAETVPMMVRQVVARYSSLRGQWVKTSEVSDEELKTGAWRERLMAEAPAGW